MNTETSTQIRVPDDDGQPLPGRSDFNTSACCDASALPDWLIPLLARVRSVCPNCRLRSTRLETAGSLSWGCQPFHAGH